MTRTTVTATVADEGASHTVKLGGVTDSDGVIDLAVGANVITVEVTAEDDSTTRDLHGYGHPRRCSSAGVRQLVPTASPSPRTRRYRRGRGQRYRPPTPTTTP